MKYSFIMLLLLTGLASCSKPELPNNDFSNWTVDPGSYVLQSGGPGSSPGPVATTKKILVDASKDGGVWWFPQFGTYNANSPHQGKALVDYLKSLGFTVDELPTGAIITDTLLDRYTNIIRGAAFSNYSASELNAYRNFLGRNTTLWLFQDHLANSVNDGLSQMLGLHFQGAWTGNIQNFSGHAITNGVTTLFYNAGSYLTDFQNNSNIIPLGYFNGNSICTMGILRHPSAKIFFIGDMNGTELVPQPFTFNVVNWLYN